MPRDEPLAENPAAGAAIDYYLKTNCERPGDAGGSSILPVKWFGVTPAKISFRQPNPDTLNIPAFWVRTPEPLSTQPRECIDSLGLSTPPPARAAGGGGGGGGFGRGAALALPGNYTVRLTVEGKSYTQSLVCEDRSAVEVNRQLTLERVMQFSFNVGVNEKHRVDFSFDQFIGNLEIRVDGQPGVEGLSHVFAQPHQTLRIHCRRV